jgi:hypothetical protein
MRTIDFETILAQATQLSGLDRFNVTEQSFAQIRDFANWRIKTAWEYEAWPDLIRTTLFPVTTANSTDSFGNKTHIYYINLPTDGPGNITNSQGTFIVDVGTVMQVTIEDPRTTGRVHSCQFSFDEYEQLLSTGIYSTTRRLIVDYSDANNTPPTEMFVTYRLPCPELVGDLWINGTGYVPGQQVYYAYSNSSYFAPTTGSQYAGKKGNFWKCAYTTIVHPDISGNQNPSAGDEWSKVKIPAIFGQYIVKGIHADWLKSEMQLQYGQQIDQEAGALLDLEVHKAIVQQGQQPRLKINSIY